MRHLLSFLCFLVSCSTVAHAQLTAVSKQELLSPAILLNAGFENGNVNWTASGGSFSVNSTAANIAYGTRSGSWDASATAQTLTSDQVTIPAGLYGRRCEMSFHWKGGDGNLIAEAIDGSIVAQASYTLAVASTYRNGRISFTCPTSGTIAFRLRSTADAAAVFLDQVYIGAGLVEQSAAAYLDADASTYALIKAPTTIASSYTLTLPVDDGTSGQVLSTDGSGNLSWAGVSSTPVTAGPVYSDGSVLQSSAFSGNGNKVVGINSGGTTQELKSFAVGTTGSDFNVAHTAGVITLNLPDASGSDRGAITTGSQTIAGLKSFNRGLTVDGTADETQLLAQGHSTQTADIIRAENSAGTDLFQVNTNGTTFGGNTTGDANYGTISSVSINAYYEGTFDLTYDTGFSVNQSVTVTYRRIGKIVCLSIPSKSATGSGATSLSNGTGMPVNLRPATQFYAWVDGVDTGNFVGLAKFTTAGAITFYRAIGEATAYGVGSVGWNGVSVCYAT